LYRTAKCQPRWAFKKIMKYLQHLLFTAVLVLAPFAAKANSIEFTSFGGLPTSVDLNTGTIAFAYYGDSGASNFQAGNGVPINNSPTTDALNLGDFTAFTTPKGGYPDKNPGGISVSYTGGVGGDNPAIGSGLTAIDQIQSSASGDDFQITSKLFAPTETFEFYLQDYSAASDITASLNDASSTTNSVTNKILSGTDPSSSTGALLTVTVTGDIGDTFTFTDAVNDTDAGTGAFGGITLLQAVTVLDAPEPSTYAMLFGGAGLLVMVARFRGKLSA
jgi:hypothetical protein